MKPESIALCNTLLEHHRTVCITGNEPYQRCVIGYLALCTNAGVPHIYRQPGIFLKAIAEWCSEKGWPPLNSLAINEQLGQPGDEYELAPGCSLLQWPAEVTACIAFRGYPEEY